MREREEAPVGHDVQAGRALLEVKGLEKRFGGLRAVDGCSFVVPEGSITRSSGRTARARRRRST